MDIQSVSKKIDELKAIILLAQRVFPSIEELFKFVGDTTPLLEEVNKAIQENLDKMPNAASKQLAKVTEATETATTEIMDTVDRITNELFNIISELETLKSIDEQRLENSVSMLRAVADGISAGKDLSPLLTDINNFISRATTATSDEHIDIISGIISRLTDIANEANTIIMALQIQDITAQQLAAVNHLLKNIQTRLSKIILHLNPSSGADLNKDIYIKDIHGTDDNIKVSQLHRSVAFDPDAIQSIEEKHTRQGDVDAFVEYLNNNPLSELNTNNGGSQGVSGVSEGQVENTADKEISHGHSDYDDSSSSIAASFEDNDNLEEFSQDDIDALFGGVK